LSEISLFLGAIPVGQGNGFIKSVLERVDEECGIKEALWLAIRGKSMSIDLTKLQMEFLDKPVYSLLYVAWSTIADIAVGAESLRYLGDFRF
jgi:hypothetical protein